MAGSRDRMIASSAPVEEAVKHRGEQHRQQVDRDDDSGCEADGDGSDDPQAENGDHHDVAAVGLKGLGC